MICSRERLHLLVIEGARRERLATPRLDNSAPSAAHLSLSRGVPDKRLASCESQTGLTLALDAAPANMKAEADK